VPITKILFFWEDCELIFFDFLKGAIKTDGTATLFSLVVSPTPQTV